MCWEGQRLGVEGGRTEEMAVIQMKGERVREQARARVFSDGRWHGQGRGEGETKS